MALHRVDLVGSRVPKFQHNAEKELDLIKAERALLAELLNRGPQTTGELNNRASRMFSFDGIADIEETLQELMDRAPSMVGIMDPAPGQKEKRWYHKLAPKPVVEELNDGISVYVPGPDKRIDQVEEMTKEIKHPIQLNFSKTDNLEWIKNKNIAQLDYDKLQFPLTLRKWKKGDKFMPLGMQTFKKLSDFFIDNKFSILDKNKQWLLCSNNDIVWVVGHRIDERYKLQSKTKKVYIAQI